MSRPGGTPDRAWSGVPPGRGCVMASVPAVSPPANVRRPFGTSARSLSLVVPSGLLQEVCRSWIADSAIINLLKFKGGHRGRPQHSQRLYVSLFLLKA